MGFANNVIPSWMLQEGAGLSRYPAFPKIPRWDKEIVLTEKIDGTNGLVSVSPTPFASYEDVEVQTWPPVAEGEDGRWYNVNPGSRNRWLTPQSDNHGFARWVQGNASELVKLGDGLHYGEWYGSGIQRNYGLRDKRFMLFNTNRWGDDAVRPACCEVATVLRTTTGAQLGADLTEVIDDLNTVGSRHVPGFMKPEGIVLFHVAGSHLFKVILEPSKGKTADGYVIKRAQPVESVPEAELAGVGA